MVLESGRRLGNYEILSPIGAGGMGEVYKARDTRFGRTVAIKVLPEAVASDPARRERFEREARAISRLNHPHICTLHDIGEDEGVAYLVMEYIEGETLAERLRKGPLPLQAVLCYGSQMADALDNAHRADIVHRDLKPGNVVLGESGAKLLDFGLATEAPGQVGGSGLSLATRARPLTQEGAVVGTLQYMAPEQLEGRDTAARTDIFALGAVLYEMVTGHKALRAARADSDKLPDVPPLLDHVIRRCMAQDPRGRWQAASDVMLELDFIADGGGGPAPVATPRRSGERIAWGMAAVALLVAVATLVLRAPPAHAPVRRLTLGPSAGEEGVTDSAGYFGALSPDGTQLVYRAWRDGVRRLWLRSMNDFVATPIPGTEGTGPPFFSPGGEWVGFDVGARELKKVSLAGGTAVSLTKGPWSIAGASWTGDTIIFGDRNSGLWRIPADGGVAEPLTELDPTSNATGHVWPEALPNGKGVLFAVTSGSARRGTNQLAVFSFDSNEWRILRDGTQPRLSTTGYLVFARDETLWAAPFDDEQLKLLGTPAPILPDVLVNRGHGTAHYTMALDGTLIYLAAAADCGQVLARVDRNGEVSRVLTGGCYGAPRFSPDGRTLALVEDTEDGTHIWIFDISRGTRLRLSVEGELNWAPVWTPDGTRVAYNSIQCSRASTAKSAPDLASSKTPSIAVSTVARSSAVASGSTLFSMWLNRSRSGWRICS